MPDIPLETVSPLLPVIKVSPLKLIKEFSSGTTSRLEGIPSSSSK